MSIETWIGIGISLISLLIAGASFRLSSKKDHKEDSAEETAIKIKLAVLEERVSNEIAMLHKLEAKLNDIQDSL